jgi:glycine/D-amino acid oxidase-like deaminating enzyme
MLEEIIETAAHRVPVLENASVLTAWTGVRPMTLDDRPILSPVSGIDGLILSCGWGGTGIIQAPLAGQLVAEIITQGTATTMDVAPFQLERFDGQSLSEVKDLRVAARLSPGH